VATAKAAATMLLGWPHAPVAVAVWLSLTFGPKAGQGPCPEGNAIDGQEYQQPTVKNY